SKLKNKEEKDMSFEEEYIRVVRHRFTEVKKLGDKTIQQLDDPALHWQYNETSNNIAILIKHMSGNMISRWTDFLTTDGEKATRHRDDEFIDDIRSKQEIIDTWEAGWQTLFHTLNTLTPGDLLKKVTIRGEAHTVIEAIERQMAHYA